MTEDKYCCQCDKATAWLAPDGRCGDCTGYTPEEIRGEVPYRGESPDYEEGTE